MKVNLEKGPLIKVKGRKHEMVYGVDGSLPNPLEAMYASIAACAAVFVKKACGEMGLNEEGISVEMKMLGSKSIAGEIERIEINVSFPDRISQEERELILKSVEICPVKSLIQQGGRITFDIKG